MTAISQQPTLFGDGNSICNGATNSSMQMADLLRQEFVSYFAYGSCMNHSSLAMSLDCDVSPYFMGAAVLDNYRLAFNYGSVREPFCCANIEPLPGAAVHGALYRLPARLLDALDAREGVNVGRYARHLVQVRQGAVNAVAALTYKAAVTLPSEGAPSDRYRALFMQGLVDSAIPENRCSEIERHIGALPHREH